MLHHHIAVASAVAASEIRQVGLIVHDLGGAVRAYWNLLGIGPWAIHTYLNQSVLRDTTYYGRPGQFAAKHALAWNGDVQFELIQPVKGPSVWQDHLDTHGEGTHHLGVFVEDHARAVTELEGRGMRLVQSGRGFGADGDGAFAYFTTDELPGIMVETIEAPAQRRTPSLLYPTQ